MPSSDIKPRSHAVPPRRRSLRWEIIAVAVIVVAVIVLVTGKALQKPAPAGIHVGAPAPASVLRALAHLPPAVGAQAGAVSNVTAAVAHPSPLAVGGRPEFLYIGADYCPFCAAQRWAIVTALDRFGSFRGIELMRSSSTDVDPSTPTFTFVHTRYKSPYIAFREVELEKNTVNAQGIYPPLQTMSASELKTLDRLDGPPYVPQSQAGSIPFVDVGGRYVWIGAGYDPGILHGLNWSQVAARVNRHHGSVADAIGATADEMTAQICAVDGHKPASVCRNPAIGALEAHLPTAP